MPSTLHFYRATNLSRNDEVLRFLFPLNDMQLLVVTWAPMWHSHIVQVLCLTSQTPVFHFSIFERKAYFKYCIHVQGGDEMKQINILSSFFKKAFLFCMFAVRSISLKSSLTKVKKSKLFFKPAGNLEGESSFQLHDLAQKQWAFHTQVSCKKLRWGQPCWSKSAKSSIFVFWDVLGSFCSFPVTVCRKTKLHT